MAIAFLIFLLLVLICFSINERINIKRKTGTFPAGGEAQLEEALSPNNEAKSSPLSEAVTELVAVAGGIYLALILLINFLKFNVPPVINLWGISLDPIAALSLIFAILQPYFRKISQLFTPPQ